MVRRTPRCCPPTLRAHRKRAPQVLAGLEDELATNLEAVAESLRDRAGVTGLGAIGTDAELLERTVDHAARRAELERVPPAMTPSEIREIYLAARTRSPR